MHNTKNHFLIDAASRYLDERSSLSVLGPLALNAMEPPLCEEVKTFWQQHLANNAPYFFSPEQDKLDQKLEMRERCNISVLFETGQIIGTVRSNLAPFEFARLSSDLSEVSDDFANYLELSRLVVIPGISLNQVEAWRALLITVISYGVFENYQGLVGVCKPSKLHVFRNYGMKAYENGRIIVPSRNDGAYNLIYGNWGMIEQAVRQKETTYFPTSQNRIGGTAST